MRRPLCSVPVSSSSPRESCASTATAGSGCPHRALPQEAYAAALAALPGIGPRTLRSLLVEREPEAAWHLVAGGEWNDRRRAQSARAAANVDVAAHWRAHTERGVQVAVLGRRGYPAALANDDDAPAVLFALGDPLVLDRHPRVAIVGTRSATRYGLALAAELGAGLAKNGVVVVSGLALGVDGAAHEGALGRRAAPGGESTVGRAIAADVRGVADADEAAAGAAPPVAVVAGDVLSPYPRAHAPLWRRVASCGAVVSEAPLGSADLAWRFPQRNRIIAALSQVVVVVECHFRGGSLHTVHAASQRGIPVGAVPGSVRSPASAGTNALLADGCFVVRDAADVMVAVGLATASSIPVRPVERRRAVPPVGAVRRHSIVAERGATAPDTFVPDLRSSDTALGAEGAVLAALGWEPCSLEELLARTGLSLDVASASLERLRRSGAVRGEAGWWARA